MHADCRHKQLPSSPDEIAEPFAVLGQGRPQADDAWEPHDSHNAPHSAAVPLSRKKRRGSDTDELASAAVYTTSPDGGETNTLVLSNVAVEESVPAKAEPKKKREQRKKSRKAKEKEVLDLTDDADDGLTEARAATTCASAVSGKPKRPRGRPKRQAAAEPPPQEPAVESGEPAGKDEVESDMQLQQPIPPPPSPRPPPRPRPQQQAAAPADAGTAGGTISAVPVNVTAPAKKPISSISSISTGQGRVPFRVGLSRRHRIAPLLKSVPRP